jgi:hypothetical protein
MSFLCEDMGEPCQNTTTRYDEINQYIGDCPLGFSGLHCRTSVLQDLYMIYSTEVKQCRTHVELSPILIFPTK